MNTPDCKLCPFYRRLNHEIAEIEFLTTGANVHAAANVKQLLYAIKDGLRTCERCDMVQQRIKEWKLSNLARHTT